MGQEGRVVQRQRFLIWCGGNPQSAAGCEEKANALPFLPPPAPLRRAALIEYRWGAVKFQIAATACSLRTNRWGDEQVTWLHCKARPIAEIHPRLPASLLTVLIPAHYITAVYPGPTFRVEQARRSGQEEVGVFPPNQPKPENALPLAELERRLAEFLAPGRDDRTGRTGNEARDRPS